MGVEELKFERRPSKTQDVSSTFYFRWSSRPDFPIARSNRQPKKALTTTPSVPGIDTLWIAHTSRLMRSEDPRNSELVSNPNTSRFTLGSKPR